MDSTFFVALNQLVREKGISQGLVLDAVEKGLMTAYKKKFHTDVNAVTKRDETNGEVRLYARKEVVEEVENDVFDIDMKSAKFLNPEAELGDEILIEHSFEEFGRKEAQSAKQVISQKLREIEKDVIYSEFIERKGEMINGYYQREKHGIIFVNLGRTEGLLPRSHQSPREKFQIGDRIKTYLYDVVSEPNRQPKIVLSRSCPEFVKKLFEMEVPEVFDGIVQIKGIVREAGYRTKVATISTRDDIDPVGTCVGMRGVRIQAIIREIGGEKIDILKYNTNVREYIKNAMNPAKVTRVLLLDEEKKKAMVVVPDSDTQRSLAIGKSGLNVKLASNLTGWSIDIRTEQEFKDSDIVEESVQKAHDLFETIDDLEDVDVAVEEDAFISLQDVPSFDDDLIKVLNKNEIKTIESLIEYSYDDLIVLEDITPDIAKRILAIVDENVEVVDEEGEDDAVDGDVADEFECGNCGGIIKVGMTECPSCKVKLIFE